MRLIEAHWTLHPVKRQGLYFDENNKPRSPWYDGEIKRKQMSTAAVARELDMSDELSVEGIVFPEFQESHIFRGAFTPNPDLHVIRTIDYGGCCAILFSQKDNYGRIFFFHEIVIEKDGNAPRLGIAGQSYSAGLVCKGFRDHDDPAGENDKWVSGTGSAKIIRAYGFEPTHAVSGASNRRRTDRIEMIHMKLLERTGAGEEVIQVHESCKFLIDAFQSGYRHPEDSKGEINIDDIEEIHPYEDVMDCFGMTLVEEFSFTKPKDSLPTKRQLPSRNRNRYTGY